MDAIVLIFGRYHTGRYRPIWAIAYFFLTLSTKNMGAIVLIFGRYDTGRYRPIWAIAYFFFDAINQKYGRYRTNPWTLSPYHSGRYHT